MSTIASVIGLENIATQFEDEIVDKVEKNFYEIKKLMKVYRVKNTAHAFRIKQIKSLIDAIDNDISDRFGIPFKHVYVNNGNYAVIPVNQGMNDALNPYRESMMRSVDSELKQCSAMGICDLNKETGSAEGFFKDYYTILKDLKETTAKIKKQMNTEGIVIDFNTAKVKNFPKGTVVYTLGDHYTLMMEYGVTPKELTAVLFHEIGHAFTHLAYSYKKIRNTTVLVDTFLDNLKKKKNIKDAMVIAGNEVYGKNFEGNEIKIFTDLTNAIVEDLNNDNVYSSIDSEQLADQFATRFGLGSALASGLDKFMQISVGGSVLVSILTVLVILFIQLLIVSLSIVVAAIGVLVFIGAVIIISIASMLITGIDASERTYDITETRFKRIKLDLIRQIRESGLDRKLRNSLLKEIEEVDIILSKYVNGKGVFGSISDIMPWNIDKFTKTRMQKELEELSENQLHVSSAKLELLLGDK